VILDTNGCDALIGTGRVFNRSTSEMEDLPAEINGKIKAIALNRSGQWVVFLTDEGLWLFDLSTQQLQSIFSGENIGNLQFH
jgi:tricorn protease-like protein